MPRVSLLDHVPHLHTLEQWLDVTQKAHRCLHVTVEDMYYYKCSYSIPNSLCKKSHRPLPLAFHHEPNLQPPL